MMVLPPLLLLLTSCSLVGGQAQDPNLVIAGGNYASTGQFPFHGYAIYETPGPRCSVVYIGGNWALTSATCLRRGSLKGITVPGIPETGGRSYLAERGIVNPHYQHHHTYTDYMYSHDIALVKIRGDPSVEQMIPAIKLPYSGQSFVHTDAYMTGYGQMENGAYPTRLRYRLSHVYPDSSCESYLGNRYMRGNMVCSYGLCSGDEGGALAKADCSSCRTYTLIGLGSFSYGCSTYLPGAFTNVAHYRDWIRSVTGL